MNPVALDTELEKRCVDTIRMLALDGVEKARSGHPGTPMGLSDITYVMWTEFLRFDPAAPRWANRDRFVLSCGHASMLIYSMLHLTGYDLSLDDLKKFRQWGSKTPGHPEWGHTAGIETTTGPLGQGIAHAVGLALGAKMLGARFNRPGFEMFDYRVFGLCSDGDLMEGISSEAGSLAGRWGLGNLNFVYDDNHITIEGDTALAFNEDVGKRFEAFGWHVQHVDGHDRPAIRKALQAAVAETTRPSLVIARTHIAFGAPNAHDTSEAHGAPLGAEEVKLTKQNLGWPEEPTFLVPEEVRPVFAGPGRRGAEARAKWENLLASWKAKYPELADSLGDQLGRFVPEDLDRRVVEGMDKDAATRQHSQAVIQKIAAEVPCFVGGSADLEPSTLTWIKGAPPIGIDDGPARYEGRNLHFGIREHAMAAVVNGLALTEAFLPFGSGFLIFTDYCRPTIRLSALMGIRSTWVFTHDSVFLGEDGPTHQPIEQISSLRAVPGLRVWRPADGVETAMAWCWSVRDAKGPNLLALTRQKLPALKRPAGFDTRDVWRGGYIVRKESGVRPGVVIVATGSEVSLALAAADLLGPAANARVVSVPCFENFLEQDAAYRESVIPKGARRVSIEAGATWGWERLVGDQGLMIGLDRFGASAPLADIQKGLGFTPEAVAERIRGFLGA